MKTLNILLLTVFSVFAHGGFAQSYSQRPISKDVQKVSNRQSFEHEILLTVFSADASGQTLSKGVQFVNSRDKKEGSQGNMKSNYPTWIIGKDVNKIGIPEEGNDPRREKRTQPDVLVRD